MRPYTISEPIAAQTALQDLLCVVGGTNRSTKIGGLHLFQTTDLGDAQEEVIQLRIRSGQTSNGSGGAAVGAIVPCDPGDTAATFSARSHDTTIASGGTILIHGQLGWNIRMDRDFWLPEKYCFTFAGARRWTIEILGAPTDSISLGFTAWIEEL